MNVPLLSTPVQLPSTRLLPFPSAKLPLTRRGWGVAALIAACLYLGARHGARSLNGIVVPALVALVAALVVVRSADPPTVRRTVPEAGFPGDGGRVTLDIVGDRLGVYTVRDGVPDGLTATTTRFDVPGDEATIEYDLAYDRRGEYVLGPVDVTVTDVLGLAHREFQLATPDSEVLVYPALVDPPSRVLRSLDALLDRDPRHGRDEFDRLREYERGDALRDVHWKSSAKRPDDDLVVAEYYDESPDEVLQIGVGVRGSLRSVDAAATAAASVTVHLLEEGIEVGLTLPEEVVEPTTDRDQQQTVLAALARLSSAALPEDAEADVRVSASNGEAVVVAGGDAVPFEPTRRDRDGPRTTEAEVAP